MDSDETTDTSAAGDRVVVAPVADALDFEGPLAPDRLDALDLEVVGEAFGRLVTDGEPVPGGVVRRLAQRYAVDPEV